jgi:hypothetical protein
MISKIVNNVRRAIRRIVRRLRGYPFDVEDIAGAFTGDVEPLEEARPRASG